MKLKSIILVVVISAATAILSVWGYSNFFQKSYTGTQEPGKLPVNYAGFFDRNTPPANVMDFTAAATSATASRCRRKALYPEPVTCERPD